MNIAAIFVDLRAWTTVPPVLVVKLKLRKQAEVTARVEIEMGHHPVHDVSIVVLRSRAKHPVVVILVLDTVFESRRKVPLRVVAKWNVLDGVEEVRALRRVCEKTPILLCREWIQRWASRIWSRTRWLRIRRLRPPTQRRERDEKKDQNKPPMALTLIRNAGDPTYRGHDSRTFIGQNISLRRNLFACARTLLRAGLASKRIPAGVRIAHQPSLSFDRKGRGSSVGWDFAAPINSRPPIIVAFCHRPIRKLVPASLSLVRPPRGCTRPQLSQTERSQFAAVSMPPFQNRCGARPQFPPTVSM